MYVLCNRVTKIDSSLQHKVSKNIKKIQHTVIFFLDNTGPLPKTVVDFWRMVWQERSQTIVMLANLVEACAVKCHKYWPETGTMTFGPFNVTITGEQILADYITREFSVQVICIDKLNNIE